MSLSVKVRDLFFKELLQFLLNSSYLNSISLLQQHLVGIPPHVSLRSVIRSDVSLIKLFHLRPHLEYLAVDPLLSHSITSIGAAEGMSPRNKLTVSWPCHTGYFWTLGQSSCLHTFYSPTMLAPLSRASLLNVSFSTCFLIMVHSS